MKELKPDEITEWLSTNKWIEKWLSNVMVIPQHKLRKDDHYQVFVNEVKTSAFDALNEHKAALLITSLLGLKSKVILPGNNIVMTFDGFYTVYNRFPKEDDVAFYSAFEWFRFYPPGQIPRPFFRTVCTIEFNINKPFNLVRA